MTVLVWYFCLVLARVAAFVTVMPLFGGNSLPKLVKTGLAVSLTVVWFMPLADALPPATLLRADAPMPWLGAAMALGREVFLGAILGYGLGLFLVPVHVAGEFLTQEMGLSFGAQVGLMGDGALSPLTQTLELMAIALFFGADGHHILLGVLHATFAQYPVLGGELPGMPVPQYVAGVTLAEEWGLMLAAPVALVLFLTTVILALLTRAAPQLNLYSIGFPLRLVVGLAACALLLPGWVGAVVGAFAQFQALAFQLL